jgi:hypothetical protein
VPDVPALDHPYAEPKHVWKQTVRAIATLICRRRGPAHRLTMGTRTPCLACTRLAAPLVVPVAEGLFWVACGQPNTLGLTPERTRLALERIGTALDVIARAAIVVTQDGGPPPVVRAERASDEG